MLPGSVLWIVGNLFLAFLPVALAFGIARGLGRDLAAPRRVRWGLWLPLLALWLLFLPNTCYLLTEWRHFLCDIHDRDVYYPVYGKGQYSPAPTISLLLLTLFYCFYTGAGLAAFFLALWPLHRLARQCWGRRAEAARAAVCFLCALGVFLGLALRFNSWDVVHPALASAILSAALQTLARPLPLTFVCLFAALLWLLYALFEVGLAGLAARRSITPENHSHAAA